MRSALRPTICAGAALAAVAAVVGVGAAAGAASPHVRSSVTVEFARPAIAGTQPERVHLLRLDLRDRHIALGAAMPGGGVGFARETVGSMTVQRHAIAGINGDFFDPARSTAMPVGGVVVDGRMVKSPRPDWNGNFYVTTDGRAHIGPVIFDGSVTRRAALLRPATTHNMWSVNTLADALKGRITYLDSTINAAATGKPCALVRGRFAVDGARVVTEVRSSVTTLGRLPSSDFALVSCGSGATPQWLRTQFRVGDRLDIVSHSRNRAIATLVSGGRQLVRAGKAFDDPHGPTEHGRNPATFACVSQAGTYAILGVVDGRSRSSRGVTYAELTRYLIGLRCYDALALDGGGSSTMVNGAGRALNEPSDGRPRKVSSAILVYRR